VIDGGLSTRRRGESIVVTDRALRSMHPDEWKALNRITRRPLPVDANASVLVEEEVATRDIIITTRWHVPTITSMPA